jgi:hypothetical protein
MRLWTLHPRYLDGRGLVAVWREGLLAQAVLRGLTTGYTKHPQLIRFRESRAPLACIRSYLEAVHEEATRRGYRFDRRKLGRGGRGMRISVTRGQLRHEWRHLKAKLAVRGPARLATLRKTSRPEAHPLFRVVPGDVEAWEVGHKRPRTRVGGRRGARVLRKAHDRSV